MEMDSHSSNDQQHSSKPPSPTATAAAESESQEDSAAETQPEANAGNDNNADSLFDGETPAFESQTQTPAPVQPGEDQDNDNQGPGAQSHSKDRRHETQNESQEQTRPTRPNPSSDESQPPTRNPSVPSSTGPHPPANGHPNTNTTTNNGPHTNIHPRPAPIPHPNGLYGMLCPPPPDPGPKPMPPTPAVHGPFSYDKDGFKTLGFKRETPYNLQMIMRDPNAAPPVEPVAKAWFHAQLIHYGIPVYQSPLRAEPLPQDLFFDLETALRNGTIKEGKLPPADILTIEDNLRRQFKGIYKQYQEAFRFWEQQSFARCKTPNDEINCSLDLFMAKYFLKGVNGRPDPRKSRYPIILHKLNDYDGVRKVVKAVPGLRSHMMPLWSVICWEEYGIERAIEEAFASISASHPSITIHVPTMEAHFHIDYFISKYWLTGLYGRPMPMLTPEPIVIEGWFGGPEIRNLLTQAVLRVPDLRVWAFIGNGIDKTVIGWGDKPFQVVEHLRMTSMHQQVASAAPQRVEIQGNPTWEWALRPHFQLCQQKADLLQSNPQLAHEPFEIEELVGSWLIQCPALENGGWGGRPGEMTIDILNWPVDSFGLVASINLKVALGTMILARSERLLDELSAYLLHDPEVLPHMPHKKRRRGDDFFVEYPRRRSPYEPVPPMRIFFDWIGRRAGEFNVELDMDLSSRNRGWVDIDMNSKVFGKGWLKYIKFFGKDNPVAFSMYKVMDQPRKMPEQWSNFRPKQMEAQLQRRTEEQMQRPIAEPKAPSTMITSKVPPPASDHTLPQRPPGPPPTNLSGFQRIRPRDSPDGIQIGVQTVKGRKQKGWETDLGKAPRVDVARKEGQEQGDGMVSHQGSSDGLGESERDNSTSPTPAEGEGEGGEHGPEDAQEEEGGYGEGHEEGQQVGEQRQADDDGSRDDAEEQHEKGEEEEEGEVQAQAQEREQEQAKEQATEQGEHQQPTKEAPQDEEDPEQDQDQDREQEEDDNEEDEDIEESYQTPAEEVSSSLTSDKKEQQTGDNEPQQQKEGESQEDADAGEDEEGEDEELYLDAAEEEGQVQQGDKEGDDEGEHGQQQQKKPASGGSSAVP